MGSDAQGARHIGLVGATGVGVGAIVGGGILVLAGVAFRATGPSALVAFGVNAVIAIITALSFAEMSTAFPESGGAYVFAKKVVSVRAAFAVGWILWFAYIVAGVLYALGFAEYGVQMVRDGFVAVGSEAPSWLSRRGTVLGVALTAAAAYTLALIRKSTGGGQFATVGKVIVFAVLIAAGIWAFGGETRESIERDLDPFFPNGGAGLLAAMGFTFIALQGFEVIAAVAGEVKEPSRTLPRAMLLSLGLAVLIYLPLLFIVSTVGTPPGRDIVGLSEDGPETVMAVAVKTYLGATGYWLVMVAAVLSTLSALHANILAASRVALTMASDRTLPAVLAQRHSTRNTPVLAIYTSALALAAILLMVPDLASAGAAASLIFLISFALAQGLAILARRRVGVRPGTFVMPWFPALPIIGGTACAALALFQGFAVPSAGGIVGVWLGLGVLLYFALFANRAEAIDASAQARDPGLAKLRGHSPFVLVPVANPESAAGLVEVAAALAPSEVGRVLLLTVMRTGPSDDAPEKTIEPAQRVLGEALAAAFAAGHRPEALLTPAAAPWSEIARVARSYGAQSLLLGLPKLSDDKTATELEQLMSEVESDVAVLRAPPGWRVARARRVLVPVAGRGAQHELRARLLGSLLRSGERDITFVRVLPTSATPQARQEAERALRRLAEEEASGHHQTELVIADDVTAAIAERAERADVVIVGLQRAGARASFGPAVREIVRRTKTATIMLSRG